MSKEQTSPVKLNRVVVNSFTEAIQLVNMDKVRCLTWPWNMTDQMHWVFMVPEEMQS